MFPIPWHSTHSTHSAVLITSWTSVPVSIASFQEANPAAATRSVPRVREPNHWLREVCYSHVAAVAAAAVKNCSRNMFIWADIIRHPCSWEKTEKFTVYMLQVNGRDIDLQVPLGRPTWSAFVWISHLSICCETRHISWGDELDAGADVLEIWSSVTKTYPPLQLLLAFACFCDLWLFKTQLSHFFESLFNK